MYIHDTCSDTVVQQLILGCSTGQAKPTALQPLDQVAKSHARQIDVILQGRCDLLLP